MIQRIDGIRIAILGTLAEFAILLWTPGPDFILRIGSFFPWIPVFGFFGLFLGVYLFSSPQIIRGSQVGRFAKLSLLIFSFQALFWALANLLFYSGILQWARNFQELSAAMNAYLFRPANWVLGVGIPAALMIGLIYGLVIKMKRSTISNY